MYDKAPPYFALPVRECLDEYFTDRWIGRRGLTEWRPRNRTKENYVEENQDCLKN
jgi:hypothetical protein